VENRKEEILEPKGRNQLRAWVAAFGGIFVILLVMVLYVETRFESANDAWLYSRGITVTIDPKIATIDDGKEGESREVEFTIKNMSTNQLNILGVTTSCSCVSSESMPISIEKGGKKSVRVTIHLEKTATGEVTQTIEYHTDNKTSPKLVAKITGKVKNQRL
jgi:Protein of unknown function (DUF1573)